MLWTKVQFFKRLSALMKVHLIAHAIFETTRSGFILILHHCSVSWNITPLYFCSSNLIYFGQNEPIEKTFSDFWVVGENSPNSSCHIWNHKSACFKLWITHKWHERQLFCTSLLKLYMICTKGTHQSVKF